jgi:hypothetical protein
MGVHQLFIDFKKAYDPVGTRFSLILFSAELTSILYQVKNSGAIPPLPQISLWPGA